MARIIPFPLGLTTVTVLFTLLSTTIGWVFEPDIFTIQPGTTNGGCDSREGVLNDWHQEAIDSIDTAIAAIGYKDNKWLKDLRVMASLNLFFGIDSYGANEFNQYNAAVLEIEENLQYVLNFFNGEKETDGSLRYNKNGFWLFCGSNFLVEKKRTDTAKDKDNKDIIDKDKKPVAIEKISTYADFLAKDSKFKPWWAGDNAKGLNGYFFDDQGRDYCNGRKNLGVTAGVNVAVSAAENREIAAVILCPQAFDGIKNPTPDEIVPPDSYSKANALITEGFDLAKAVPKSATLVHEMFHALRGEIFLAGDDEEYNLIKTTKLAGSSRDSARKNPESYVFFVAHMFHLFGQAADGISKNWDFAIIDGGANKADNKEMIVGAKKPGPAEIDPGS